MKDRNPEYQTGKEEEIYILSGVISNVFIISCNIKYTEELKIH